MSRTSYLLKMWRKECVAMTHLGGQPFDSSSSLEEKKPPPARQLVFSHSVLGPLDGLGFGLSGLLRTYLRSKGRKCAPTERCQVSERFWRRIVEYRYVNSLIGSIRVEISCDRAHLAFYHPVTRHDRLSHDTRKLTQSVLLLRSTNPSCRVPRNV